MRSLCDELLEHVYVSPSSTTAAIFFCRPDVHFGALGVHWEQHAGGVNLGHDAEQVGRAPCVAGAVYYLVPLHIKLVKAVVVYPLVVQNHFLVVRLACRVNVE
jgi:hypothetical protein